FCPQGKTAESCGFCASCHPLQISLAPLRDTSEICKEAIFALGNGISRCKNQHPFPTYTPPGTIFMRESFGPLALSRGWTDGMFFFLEMIFVRELGFLSYPRGRPTKAPPAAAVFGAGGFVWENLPFGVGIRRGVRRRRLR